MHTLMCWPRTMIALLIAAGTTLAAAGPLAAQDEMPDAVRSSAQTPAATSVVNAFFISHKTDPISGEESIEILGSMIIWFLLVLSMLSIGFIGNMALTNQRKSILPAGVVEAVERLVKASKYREVLELTRAEPSFFSQVVHAGISEASHGFASVLRAMEQTADELTTNRLRRLEYLNVLGQVSPMIGLFGTVYGMILAFQAIVLTGGDADPILLAGGISTALTTTFWGLVVAIPALAGYAVVRNRIDQFTAEATMAAEALLNQFRPRPGGRGSGGSAPAKPAPQESTS